MRISDWSSDVCSSDLLDAALAMAKAMQEMLPPRKRNNSEPCRRSQPTHMFPSPARTEEVPAKRKRGRPPLPRRTPVEAAQRNLESWCGGPLPAQRVRGLSWPDLPHTLVSSGQGDAGEAAAEETQQQRAVPPFAANAYVPFACADGRGPGQAQAGSSSPSPAHPGRGGAAHIGELLRGPTAFAAGPGSVTARPTHQQGLRCTRRKGSAQPLLHQTVTSLYGRNSVFSKLQEHIILYQLVIYLTLSQLALERQPLSTVEHNRRQPAKV